MTQHNDVIVKCEGLTKIYREITALDNLNLEIRRGHVFGFIGHNGAGKTTTIRILAGMLTSSRGKATIGGVDVSSGRDRIKSLVGYMPDSFGVYDQMRVWEYLDFFGAAFKIPRAKRSDRIDFVLDLTDAEYMRDRFVDTLSHGMKQRIGIARTLMHDPEVLLFDEPANGLDPQARVQMRKLLRRLADSGKTLMVSSHILPELAVICDDVGIIHKGQLKAAGPLQEVLEHLHRDRTMELKASLDDLKAAVKVVSTDAQCSHVDTADMNDERVIRFRFSGDDDVLSALLARLFGAGIRPITFREIPLSLEDAYLAISGQVPGDTPANDGEPASDGQPADTSRGGR